ncbi:MAG: COR domain-containing protein [Pseudomonadota bacterium]
MEIFENQTEFDVIFIENRINSNLTDFSTDEDYRLTFDLVSLPIWREDFATEAQLLFSNMRQALTEFNSGFDVWLDWYEERLQGSPLQFRRELSWTTLSQERLGQNAREKNAYLKQLWNEHSPDQLASTASLRPLNRVRTIFIGPGAAGKTSLIRAMRGEKVVEKDQERTPGADLTEASSIELAAADVFEHKLEGTEITVHFWDFGGQVMAHATHQFFLRSKCLYVIVLDAGSERIIREERTANTEAEYWLEHVRAYGDSAPVILVGGKCDRPHQVSLDLNSLKQRYPNIVGFYQVSATKARGKHKPEFKIFTRVWAEQLVALGVHSEMFSAEQFAVMEAVKKKARKQDFLSFDDYEEICDEEDLPLDGPTGGETLRDLMDKLGIIMHFAQLHRLDADLLNPSWLTYGVYTLLFDKRSKKKKGRITFDDVVKILKNPPQPPDHDRKLRYPRSRCGTVVDAMGAFKVAYRLERDDSQIIIPALLPESQPDHDFVFDGALAFQFDCDGLLPPHVLPALIVDNHKDIARYGRDEEDVVWEYGVLLRPERGYNAEALVIARTRNQQKLDIYVKGADASDYITSLRKNVLDSISDMPDLKYQEKVQVTPDMRIDDQLERFAGVQPHYISYKAVKNAHEHDLPVPGEDDFIYDSNKIMKIFPAVSGDPRHQIMISYSRKDRAHVEALVVKLEDEGFTVWYDKELNAGKRARMRRQINQAIDTARVVLALWSPNSADSDWVLDEADHAWNDDKLISLRLPELERKQIPKPFGAKHVLLHTSFSHLKKALAAKGLRSRR